MKRNELLVQVRPPRLLGVKADVLRMMISIGVPVNLEAFSEDIKRGYRWRVGRGRWQALPSRRK